MKFPVQSTVYVACATVLFGSLATEIGSADYAKQTVITKVIMFGFVGLAGWMLLDSIKEYKKNHEKGA